MHIFNIITDELAILVKLYFRYSSNMSSNSHSSIINLFKHLVSRAERIHQFGPGMHFSIMYGIFTYGMHKY